MNNIKKLNSQHQTNENNFQSDELPNQWQVHNNRLNFLEQTMTKMQKKLLKIQKRISSNQQSQKQHKIEFQHKFSQMISVISEQQSNNQNILNTQILNELEKEIKNVKYTLSQNMKNFQIIQKEVIQLTEKTCFYFNVNELQEYLNDRITTLQQKNKKYLNQQLIQINRNIQQMQKTVDLSKNQSTFIQLSNNHIHNQNANILNNSGFSKSSSQNALSNSRAHQKVISPRSTNFNQYNTIDNIMKQSPSSKRLTFTEQDRKQKYQKDFLTGNIGSGKSFNSPNIQQGLIQASQNNSRVVYLRQKLKQFQQINKKYQKKQIQYQNKLKSQSHQHNNTKNSNSRDSKNFSTHFQLTNKKLEQIQCQEQCNNNFNKKLFDNNSSKRQIENRLTFSRHESSANKYNRNDSSANKYNRQDSGSKLNRQDSTSRKYGNGTSSAKKFTFNNENSAKKVDKLKSIKDYLQQSESQLEQSFLEPNYKITKN